MKPSYFFFHLSHRRSTTVSLETRNPSEVCRVSSPFPSLTMVFTEPFIKQSFIPLELMWEIQSQLQTKAVHFGESNNLNKVSKTDWPSGWYFFKYNTPQKIKTCRTVITANQRIKCRAGSMVLAQRLITNKTVHFGEYKNFSDISKQIVPLDYTFQKLLPAGVTSHYHGLQILSYEI